MFEQSLYLGQSDAPQRKRRDFILTKEADRIGFDARASRPSNQVTKNENLVDMERQWPMGMFVPIQDGQDLVGLGFKSGFLPDLFDGIFGGGFAHVSPPAWDRPAAIDLLLNQE